MPEWVVVSYIDPRRRTPVEEYLDRLPVKDRARVIRVIELLETYGAELRMPHARHLRRKLWELRVDARPTSYRVIFAALPGRQFVLLHMFAKKTDTTPSQEIENAERRMADYLARSRDDE